MLPCNKPEILQISTLQGSITLLSSCNVWKELSIHLQKIQILSEKTFFSSRLIALSFGYSPFSLRLNRQSHTFPQLVELFL